MSDLELITQHGNAGRLAEARACFERLERRAADRPDDAAARLAKLRFCEPPARMNVLPSEAAFVAHEGTLGQRISPRPEAVNLIAALIDLDAASGAAPRADAG